MLVIFDCDGVLVDSEIIAAEVDAAALTSVGYAIDGAEVARRFAGLTGREIFARVAAELGRPLPDDLEERTKAEIDRRLAAELEVIEGVREAIEALGLPVCVCSNSSPERIAASLTKTRLDDLFGERVFSAVAVREGRPKPAPDVYLHAAETCGVDPHDAIVIEDSEHGVAAARAAGMSVIGFVGGRHSWPGHSERLMEAGADTVIRRMSELVPTVRAYAEGFRFPA